MTPDEDLIIAAETALATLGAVYQWVDMVDAAGGATSIAGIAKCHAMLNSLKSNKPRVERMVLEPLRAAIAKAEAP